MPKAKGASTARSKASAASRTKNTSAATGKKAGTAKPNDAAKEKAKKPLGGWHHPAAIGLLLLAILWGVGTYFTTTDADFLGGAKIPLLSDLGAWNYLIAAGIALIAVYIADRTRPAPGPREPGKVANRWAAPLMLGSALIGLIWIVVFYTIQQTSVVIPFFSDLGNWNIVIGMGFICAAFVFATKWE